MVMLLLPVVNLLKLYMKGEYRMLPEGQMDDILIYGGYTKEIEPSRTYQMLIEDERIMGMIDDIDAMAQSIYKEINTEADVYPIYRDYGIKKRDLFGKSKPYAFMMLQFRIKQKLELDDRIESVENFVYDEVNSKGNDLVFSFEVKSIYGKISIKEVLQI